MAKVLLMAMAIVFSGAQTFAQQNQSFQKLQCVNSMFREAQLTLDPQRTVSIQDYNQQGSGALAKHLKKTLGKDVQILGAKLTLDAKALHCNNAGLYLLNCDAGPTPGRLTLRILTDDAPYVRDVAVIRFTLKSLLTSDGGKVELGDKPVTVTLNKMVVTAKAQVILDGKPFRIKWEPFFYTGQDRQGSSCVKNWFEP